MPSFDNALNSSVLPLTYRFVQIRKKWTDTWKNVQYLTPLSCKAECAPSIDQATFRYDTGMIKREDQTSFAQYNPVDIRDYFVRILVQFPGQSATPLWYGVITDIETTNESCTAITGTQIIRALGIAHILNRQPLTNGFVQNVLEGVFDGITQEIDWMPSFNEYQQRGRALRGNQTFFNSDPSSLGVSVFHFGDSAVWTNKNILDYLLYHYSPPNVKFAYTGPAAALDKVADAIKAEGQTVWQLMNRLIDRRRGFGFYFTVDNNSNVILVNIFSIANFPITIGGCTLPANANQQSFTLPTTLPYSHLVEDIPLNMTSTNQYGLIHVRGNRIKVCGTFSYIDGTLKESWATDNIEGYDEQAYKYASSTGDEVANDLYRAASIFDHLWVRHEVVPSWDWMCGDGVGGTMYNCAPSGLTDGTVLVSGAGADVTKWNYDKFFERDLPFLEGGSYSASGEIALIHDPDNLNAAYLPMALYICDVPSGSSGTVVHTPDNKWHHVEKLHDANKDLHSLTAIRPLNEKLGFEFGCSPKHYVSNNWWSVASDGSSASLTGLGRPVANPTQYEPELDYRQLVLTAQWKTDARQFIQITNAKNDLNKMLTIDVDSAEYWYVSPGTVVGVTEKGELEHIDPTKCIVRNDVDILQKVASYASQWFSVPRQTVQLPIHSIGLFCQLGTYLTSISAVNSTVPIGTVVTSRQIDFQSGTTTIATSWNDLDFELIAQRR